jgi:hypothetical protein
MTEMAEVPRLLQEVSGALTMLELPASNYLAGIGCIRNAN